MKEELPGCNKDKIKTIKNNFKKVLKCSQMCNLHIYHFL